MRNIFIFEGPDFSGKSTQAKLFAQRLRATTSLQVHECREPGGTELGEYIRAGLKGGLKKPLAPRAELFLFLASRYQLVHEVLLANPGPEHAFVFDRFLTSTYVYQGIARGSQHASAHPGCPTLAELQALHEPLSALMRDRALEFRLGASSALLDAAAEKDGRVDPRYEADRGFVHTVREAYSEFPNTYIPWPVLEHYRVEGESESEVAAALWASFKAWT